MINLLVDEAYAFDYLAILAIKQELAPSEQKLNTYLECKNYLSNQINNFNEIIISDEYNNLYNINKATFILIDNLRDGQLVTAKAIDDANMERFYKKKDLQNRFFPNSSLKEEKITK